MSLLTDFPQANIYPFKKSSLSGAVLQTAMFLLDFRHAKRHNFYTNKVGSKIILPEKVRKLCQNFSLNKTV